MNSQERCNNTGSSSITNNTPSAEGGCQQSSDGGCTSKVSGLVGLLHERDSFSLRELEDLRAAIEYEQQIQMTLKRSNPAKVQIQCRHFKSKKCSFQITFRAVVSEIACLVAASKMPSVLCQEGAAAVVVRSYGEVAVAATVSATDASFFSSRSLLDSSLQEPFPPQSVTHAKRAEMPWPNETGCETAAAVPPSALLPSHAVGCQSRLSLPHSEQPTSEMLLQQLQPPSASPASMSHDALLDQHTTQMVKMATMREGGGEKNEGRAAFISHQITLQENQDNGSDGDDVKHRGSRDDKYQNHANDDVIIIEETTSQSSHMKVNHRTAEDVHQEEESYLAMIDEEQMIGDLCSFHISPFILDFEQQESMQLIPPFSIDGLDTEEEEEVIFCETKAADDLAEIQVEEGEGQSSSLSMIRFKLCNCKLLHRNHPVMNDQQYNIHLAKRWLEGHQQKIERIYSEMREAKGHQFKITPKIIRSQLLESFDIDIYAKCADKDHKRFLKKKLDNLMKAIRQKERAASSAASKRERETGTTTSKAVVKKKKSCGDKQQHQQPTAKNRDRVKDDNPQTQTVVSNNESPLEDKIKESQTKERLVEEIQTNTDNVSATDSLEPIKQPHQQLVKQVIESENLTNYALPLQPQPKVYKEEWESFIQLELPQRLQSAH